MCYEADLSAEETPAQEGSRFQDADAYAGRTKRAQASENEGKKASRCLGGGRKRKVGHRRWDGSGG